jgi:hypothetical protein
MNEAGNSFLSAFFSKPPFVIILKQALWSHEKVVWFVHSCSNCHVCGKQLLKNLTDSCFCSASYSKLLYVLWTAESENCNRNIFSFGGTGVLKSGIHACKASILHLCNTMPDLFIEMGSC